MAETDKTTPAAKAMTAADAAKLVKRKLVERKPAIKNGEKVRDADGNVVFEEATRVVPIAAKEVLSFKDYGSRVVVVTTDGKKFSSADGE